MLWELNKEGCRGGREGTGPALQGRKGGRSGVSKLRGCVVPASSPTVFLLGGPLLHKMVKSRKEGREQVA